MRRGVKVGKAFDLEAAVEDRPPEPEKRRKKVSPRRVALGQDFDAKVSLSKDWVDVADAITRSRMVWAVLAIIGVFLFGAAGLGLYRGEFGALQGVWAVAGPVYGGIAGYFFSRHGRK